MALHSPSAASSPSQEPPQAPAEAELPVSGAREQNILKWPNFSNFVVVCVASVAVTFAIMIALGIRAFIECPKQISELAQRLIVANSDFAKVLTECYEESSDLKQQLLNVTFDLIAAINELKNMTNILQEQAKIAVLLKEKLDLIQHVNLTKTCTHLLEKAVQDLKHVYNSYATVRTGVKKVNIKNLRLKEVAGSYTNWLKRLEKENRDLQTIKNSRATLLMEENQLRINNQNLRFDAKNYSTLRTKIQYLREFVDQCTKDLKEKNRKLQTNTTCCIKDLEEENLKVQNIISSYVTLSSEVNQLTNLKNAIIVYLQLNKENQKLKEHVEYHTGIRNCTEDDQVLRALAEFVSVWKYCDSQTLQCSQCMTNWVSHSSQCFFLSTDRKPWMDARAECVRLGGDLAIASSLPVQKFLNTLVQKASVSEESSAWIGVSDLIDESLFYWVNGSRVHGGYWKNKYEGLGEYDCVAIVIPAEFNDEHLTWKTLNCTHLRQYICETTALK